MQGIQEWSIPAVRIKSLCWQGDTLVDWVAGGNVYYLDGTTKPRHVSYSYRFDEAMVSPSGTFAVIYEKLGTKGLVLKNGDITREINRSFYYAHAYEYPVTLFQLPNGQEMIAHCPESFCRLDIDDLETGKRLTHGLDRKCFGPFHSRLAVNRAGTLLLSAGWVWQPRDTVRLYDIRANLNHPNLLDEGEFVAEVSSAVFQNDEKLVLAHTEERYDEEEDTSKFAPGILAIYDIQEQRNLSQVTPEDIVGTVMPIGTNLIVGFYEHPKLINLATGKVLYHWREFNSGKQHSSILWTTEPIPPLALDTTNSRFAVADKSAIHVVQVDPAEFSQ